MTDKPENPLVYQSRYRLGDTNADMTLRDYFAAHSPPMTEQWWLDSKGSGEHWTDVQAAFAYRYADAMLKARRNEN